jgi:hypothetical protein
MFHPLGRNGLKSSNLSVDDNLYLSSLLWSGASSVRGWGRRRPYCGLEHPQFAGGGEGVPTVAWSILSSRVGSRLPHAENCEYNGGRPTRGSFPEESLGAKPINSQTNITGFISIVTKDIGLWQTEFNYWILWTRWRNFLFHTSREIPRWVTASFHERLCTMVLRFLHFLSHRTPCIYINQLFICMFTMAYCKVNANKRTQNMHTHKDKTLQLALFKQ